MNLASSYRLSLQILAIIVILRLEEISNLTTLAKNIKDQQGLLVKGTNHQRGSIFEGTNDNAKDKLGGNPKDKPESLFENAKDKPGSLGENSRDKHESSFERSKDNLGSIVDVTEGKLGSLVESIKNNPISTRQNAFSCINNCGRSFSLPCSCDVICQVYHNCCEDFIEECASTLLKFENSYEHYKDSLIECSNENVYVIASCPKQQLYMKSESKRQKKDVSQDLTTTGQMRLTLKDIWRNMPVTDISSRLVFKNKSISDCYPHKTVYLYLWHALFDHLEMTESKHHYFIDLSATYAPQFETPQDTASFYEPHQCVVTSIGACSISKYKDLCSTFTSYVRAENMLVYDNVYCAQCAGWNDTSLLMPVTFVGRGSRPKISMSSSLNYDIVTFKTEDSSENQKWHFLECSLEQESQNQLKCRITACNSFYYKLHDGQCLSLSVLSVAFFNLGVTPRSDRPMISAYIMCLLKYHAEFFLVGEWRPAQIFYYPQVYFQSNFLFYPSTDSIEIFNMNINRYNLLRLISISKILKYTLGLSNDKNEAHSFVEDFEETQIYSQYEVLFVDGSLENVSINLADGYNSTTLCLCVVPLKKVDSIFINEKLMCNYTCIMTSSFKVPVIYNSMCLLDQDFHLNSYKLLQTDILTLLLFTLFWYV